MPSMTRPPNDGSSATEPAAAFEFDRRMALRLLAGGLAMPLASCAKPFEEIVPYVDMPERVVAGEPLKFATTLALSGYGIGVLATSIDGRPIKIEGNPRHPASLGATDVFAEAAIMSLYDPDRSKAPRTRNDISTWDAFAGALRAQLEREQPRRGAGLRIVSGRTTSPTLRRQIADIKRVYPLARWVRYDAVPDDAAPAGAALAYGRPLAPLARLGDCAVVLALDADPLGPGPQQIANARALAQRRQADAAPFLRLYAAEPELSLTGAYADHRLALPPQLIGDIALAVAAALRGEDAASHLPPDAVRFARAAAADLIAHKGHALVMVGPRQPPAVHAAAHWINAELQAPVDLIDPVDPAAQDDGESLTEFATDLENGRVETLIILGANPAYDAPGRLGIAKRIGKVAFSAHLGLHDDETAVLCRWHLPQSHPLESWSDLRGPDGTASIVQPLIRPLYDTRTAHEFVGLLAGQIATSAYETVRQTWRNETPTDGFEDWWRRALHDGVIAGSAAQPVVVGAPKPPALVPARPPAGMTLLLAPDPAVWDGSFANNPWLQECPRPFTKEVWDNSLGLSPTDATRIGVRDGDMVQIADGERTLRGPVRIIDGQAAGVITATLGYGRSRAGAIGNGIGFDVYPLRAPDTPWHLENVTVAPTGGRHSVASTQQQFRLDGEARDLYPILTLAELAQGKQPPDHDYANKPSMLPPVKSDGAAWAMVIDTSACTGCNACVVACQAENNVPVVGPEQALLGRDMHWLRIDSYVVEAGEPPGFEPVPCMQCEIGALRAGMPGRPPPSTTPKGLNAQVYNRCVGTRFCQANCPYKVRKFNWFGLFGRQEYADLGAMNPMKARNNPDVTVRARGVMEKCTYCVQRISRARRRPKSRRTCPIADGGVVTACQERLPDAALSASATFAQCRASRRKRRATARSRGTMRCSEELGHPAAHHISGAACATSIRL